MFGREEVDEIEPAARECRSLGLDVRGPIPADIVYPQARSGMWDCVVAMYHDQGHIPIKTASFEYDPRAERWTKTGGVTLTLGLPAPRTSVDHGTAFDIAGRCMAGHQAMGDAIRLADAMAFDGSGGTRT
jgi:4-hydroxythreonine-4-phosphate dehydrogenase